MTVRWLSWTGTRSRGFRASCGGAPVPGATSGGGGKVYGPDDSYIAAANALKRNMVVVTVIGCLVGGGLVVL